MTETTAAPAPAEAKPNHGLSLADAVAKMRANRASAAAPTPAEPASEPAAEASNPEPGETAEATGVEGAEQPETDTATDEQADAPATEEPTGEGVELADDSKLVLPDGSEWTAKELVEGTMRLRDYTKKTQALAEERKTLDTHRQALDAERRAVSDKAREIDTALQQELAAAKTAREQYAAQVEQISALLNKQDAEWSRIDWQAERMRDPQAAAAKWMDYQLHRDAMAAAERERADLAAKAKADADESDRKARDSAAQAWQGQRQALEQHITSRHADLMDPEKGKHEFRAMAATAEAAGIPGDVFLAALGHTPQDGVPIMAAPVFELLRKATRYDQLVSEQTKALASDKAPRPDATGKIKVVKAGAARFRPPSPTDSAVGRAQADFNRNRSVEDAVALMKAKRAANAARLTR